MRIRKTTTYFASAAVALTIALTGAPSASAATASAAGVQEAARIAPSAATADPTLDPRLASTTDLELLLFMMTGAGPIGAAHPELIDEFGISSVASPEQVEAVTPVAERFIATYPAFSAGWAPAIRSADHDVVMQGRRSFVLAFMEFVQTTCRPSCTA